MPYIGKEPIAGNFVLLDSITTSATATYALTKSSVAYSPESARNMIVSLNGVTQAPETAFTVSGSNITFSSALTSSDVIDYILVLGDVLNIGTPSDGTVGTSQMSYPLGNFSSTGIDDNASSTAVTIDSSERVGINVTDPDEKLEVGGDVKIGQSGDSGVLHFGNTSDQTKIIGRGSSHSSLADTMDFYTDENIRVRLDSSGNVGIGTTSPASMAGGTSTNPVLSVGGADTSLNTLGDRVGSISFVSADLSLTNTFSDGVAGEVACITDTSTGGGNSLAFYTANTGVGRGERMRITSGGIVGIGTTSPASTAKLSISDSSIAAISIDNPSGRAYELTSTSTGSFGLLDRDAVAYRMFVNSSGNVGIGTTSPDSLLHVGTGTNTDGTNVTFTIGGDSANSRQSLILKKIQSGDRALQIHATAGGSDEDIRFFSDSSTERMRIDDSGNLLVNTTATPAVRNEFSMGFSPALGTLVVNCPTTTGPLLLNQTVGDTASRNQIRFFRSETQVGSITSTDSATAYNTSSDVRLKENIVDAPAGSLDDIQVRSFDWKAGGLHQKYGLIAQELVDVAPEAVHQGETDDEMWSVDYSKLVPMMIKEIQDLKAEVAALKGV